MADETNYAGLQFSPAQTGWGIGAQALGQALPSLVNPYGNVGTNLGITLGGALLQGLLAYQARSEATEQSIMANRIATQMLAQPDPTARLGLVEALDDTAVQRRLLGLNERMLEQQLAREQAAAAKSAELKAGAEFELGDLGTKLYDRELKLKTAGQGSSIDRLLLEDKLMKERAVQRKELGLEDVDVPDALKNQAFQQNAAANQAIDLATAVESYTSTPEFLASKSFSAFGDDQLKSDFRNLAANVILSKTGKSATEAERQNLNSIVAGDFTAIDPKVVAGILRKYAKTERLFAADMIEAATQRPETFVKELREAAEKGRRSTFKTRVPSYGAEDPTIPTATPTPTTPVREKPDVAATITRLQAVASNPMASEATKAAALAEIDKLIGS